MTPRNRRAALLTLLLAALLLVPAPTALAHTVSGVGATNFRTVLHGITPTVPGVTLQVVENGSRLELRNTTGTDVLVDGYIGEPYARVGPSGTYLNDNSPATYVNADRYGRTAVPPGVDAKATPKWRKISGSPLLRWHDHRIHWMLPTMPPAVTRFPADFHRISSWTITLHYAGRQLSAAGELDWVPGPNPAGWLVLGLLLVVVTGFGLPSRGHRTVAAALAVLVGVDVTHSALIAAAAAGGMSAELSAFVADNLIQLACWAVAIAALVLLARRRTAGVWTATAAAALIAVASGVTDLPALWRSSAPLAGPLWIERLLIIATVGIGFGLVLALPLFLRRERLTAARPAAEDRAATDDRAVTDDRAATDDCPPNAPSGSANSPEAALQHADDGTPGADSGHGSGATPDDGEAGHRVSRRRVLTASGLAGFGGLGAGIAIGAAGGRDGGAPATSVSGGPALTQVGSRAVPFHGEHQAGIITPDRQQARIWIAAFDLAPGADRAALRGLLQRWSSAAERLTSGAPLAGDDLVTAGSGPSSLTVTVGVGPSLFGRAGLPGSARPEALATLPAFRGERLDRARSDGDLGVVISADDALVVFHAARALQRLAHGAATLRWQMSGFSRALGASPDDAATPRNLMGQLDGTNNPKPSDPTFTSKIFTAADAGPAWTRGGSYLVVRRIRMLLDRWDTLPTNAQERIIGRRKDTGAPLSGGTEFTPANYGATGPDGSPLIPPHAHIRMSTAAFNNGATILRRGYSYADGTRPDGSPDAGLLFLAWQADPRTGFIPIQQRLTTQDDALNPFIEHETSALFFMPPGVRPGGFLAQALVES